MVTEGLDEAVQILGDLVAFPTVTTESNLELIEYAVALIEPLGAEVELTYDEDGGKANLFATIGPRVDGGVILSGHTDVVPATEEEWTGSPFLIRREGERIFGRGTADTKGFIACALALAPRFSGMDLLRPVQIALTFDEEVGCRGVPLLIDGLARSGLKPGAVVVGEPTRMEMVNAHKGMYEYTTRITGLEGHASKPYQAVNAVEVAARFVGELIRLGEELAGRAAEDSPFDPPHTTISVGSIRGGIARNIVAGECELEWEMRPVDRADVELVQSRLAAVETRLVDEMRAVSEEASLITLVEGEVDGLEADPDSLAARMLAQALGSAAPRTAPFGTEAGLYQRAGIPAVVCGPGSIDVAHQPDEFVPVDQLEACLVMMVRLVEQLTAHS